MHHVAERATPIVFTTAVKTSTGRSPAPHSRLLLLLAPLNLAPAATTITGGWYAAPSAAQLPRRGEVRNPPGYHAKAHVVSPLPGHPDFRGTRAWHDWLRHQGVTDGHGLDAAFQTPTEFTWGNVNGTSYLTPIRNQYLPQYCGSCWAFAAASSLSDRVKIARDAKGSDVQISVQHILNCASMEGGSCEGGSAGGVYQWAQEMGPHEGISLESNKPYIACSAESPQTTVGLCNTTRARELTQCKPRNVAEW